MMPLMLLLHVGAAALPADLPAGPAGDDPGA
jgi:hypothetical protein